MYGIISLYIIIKQHVDVVGTSGSSSLNRHLRTCTVKNANTNQACIVHDSYSNSLLNASLEFNQVRSMKCLVELILWQEMPFCFVEYSGLNVFLKGLNPLFKLCSRRTMQRNMMKNYTLAKEVSQRLILKSGNSMLSATTD